MNSQPPAVNSKVIRLRPLCEYDYTNERNTDEGSSGHWHWPRLAQSNKSLDGAAGSELLIRQDLNAFRSERRRLSPTLRQAFANADVVMEKTAFQT